MINVNKDYNFRAPPSAFPWKEALIFMMTNLQTIQKLQEIVKNKPYEYQAVEDLFEMLRIYESEDEKQAHIWNKDVCKITTQQVKLAKSDTLAEKFYYLNKKSLLFDALIDFDAYLQYIEFNREPEKRFYLPRRKKILPIVQAMQDLEDDKLDLLSISMLPCTGKTQPLDSKVLTPKGFVKMGEIKVGDVVIAGNGKYSRVIGVFSQGVKDVYRVNFSDDTSTKRCGEHLWKVQTRDDR